MGKKVFRHSPHRGADAIKILAGTKTNATIRDIEETTEDIEEKEGVVQSISKDKINGDGWIVKTDDGVYNCSCASNMYQLPETEEYGGVYYPTETVQVKITINPVLRTNTITEITSLGENEESLDLSKWKHGDKATTIIAKPKSAISVSDAIISFNYNNANEVIANEEEIKTNGKKTNIGTTALDINSEEINIGNMSLEDYLNQQALDALLKNSNKYRRRYIDITKQNDLAQLSINVNSFFIPADSQRVVADLKDPSLYPEKEQRHPLLTGSNNIDELYIYPNGLVTMKSRDKAPRYETDVFSTHNWVTAPYTYKNLLNVVVTRLCDCCSDGSVGKRVYFNYCPHCKTWTTLYNNNGVINCTACDTTYCQSCGHPYGYECNNTIYNLKPYNLWNISAIGLPCEYCKDDIEYGKTREYANYCPKCHQWGYLKESTEYINNSEHRFLHCDYCNEDYCVNCSISQGKSFIKNFINDETNYDYFEKNYSKIKHIRDD